MKHIFRAAVLLLSLFGCSSYPIEKKAQGTAQPWPCLGTSTLPNNLANKFEAIEDEKLLEEARGDPKDGKLCQGQVYKSKEGAQITVFRAWNSTNPKSKFGNWWAFERPAGKISTYRTDYEICYQWSPLDKLVSCTLNPKETIVVGTGQSAECSEYLTYATSDKQQIYIKNASAAVSNCTVLDGEFLWK